MKTVIIDITENNNVWTQDYESLHSYAIWPEISIKSPRKQFNYGIGFCKDLYLNTIVTNSDHIINGVRVGVKKGYISDKDVSFVFYKNSNKFPEGNVEKFIININNKGEFDVWPAGLLDQWEIALKTLF
jgi:hypothetical protein